MDLSEATLKVELLNYLMEILCFKLPDNRYKPISYDSDNKNHLHDKNDLDNLSNLDNLSYSSHEDNLDNLRNLCGLSIQVT